MPLPNFAIIGTAKSATTSLYFYLKQHPQIYMSAGCKEPNFFAYGEAESPRFAGPVAQLPDPYASSLAAYTALFAGVKQGGNHAPILGKPGSRSKPANGRDGGIFSVIMKMVSMPSGWRPFIAIFLTIRYASISMKSSHKIILACYTIFFNFWG